MMKKILLVCMALLSMFGASAQAPPTTSTAGNDVWYYILCKPRSADLNAKWLTGGTAGDIIINSVFSATNDAILWKVVDNAGVLGLVNKQYGTYLDTDRPYDAVATSIISCVSAAPALGLEFAPYVDQVAEPNGFYMVNVGAGAVTNATTGLPFQFYSAGVGSLYRPINYGVNVPNVNSSVKFLTAKMVLAELITTVTTANTLSNATLTAAIAAAQTVYNDVVSTDAAYLDARAKLISTYNMFLSLAAANVGYTNSSEGLNPGQVSAEDREQLKNVIDAAQLVFDNVASTPTEIDAAKGEVDAIFAMFKTQVILPELSTSADIWYYIQGTRPANTYLTAPAAGIGTQVKDLVVIPDDTQLWRLVPNEDGFALQNKGSMEYLQTDFPTGTNLNTQVAMPLKALRFITSGETYNKSYRFWIENTISSTEALRLHAGGSGNGWGLMSYTGDKNDNCTWLFLSYDELFRTQLATTLTTAHELYTASASNLGDAFGQYSSATRITFAAVIATADALETATMSQDELIAAKTTLDNATIAFTVNADVTLLSSATQLKWFRFVNAMSPAGYATGKAMTSNARILDQAFTYETVDAVSDAQLFRFEMNGDYSKATTLVNKANGLYVSATGTMVAAPTDVNEFEITPLDGFSFWIKPTTQAPLHAAASQTDIVNWNSGAGSASAWKIEYVKSEPNTADLNPAYTAALLQSRNYYNITSGGTEYGQYPLVARTSFNAIIATEEAKTQSTLTHQQLGDGINAITDASKSYKASLNATLDAAKWYSLESVKVPGKFLNVDPATNAISCEAASITDNQKFHFVAKPSIGMYKNLYEISSRSVPTGSIRCENAAWDVNYNTGTVFSAGATAIALGYWPWNATLSFGVSGTQTLLQSLDGDGVGTDDGVAVINKIETYNGASAWRIVVADGANAIAVTDSNADISISVKNRMIIVSGSEATVKVFTISGIQVNATKALYSGIYLVKVNNIVKKVIVE